MSDERLIVLQQRLDSHIQEFHAYKEQESARWSHLIECQERNTKSIQDLTASTRGLVEAWQAANGTIKVMSAFGQFVKWLSGLAIVGGIISWFVQNFRG